MTEHTQNPTVQEAEAQQPGRGRDAPNFVAIPLRGWLDILVRVWNSFFTDHILLISAGIAFYGLLAAFPAISALMAIAGLIYQPTELVDALQGLSRLVPPDVSKILFDQARSVAGSEQSGLTLGVILGLMLALFSASAGVASLIEGLNLAYSQPETRNFIKLRFTTILITIAMILSTIFAALLIVAVPIALAFLPVAPGVQTAISILRYIPLAMIFLGGVIAIYRIGPDRKPAQWAWLVPGTVVAAILWLIMSIGFSLYVENFASYNETFGSIAGVIVLLVWMWLSAVIVLLGAELNSEIEAQTARDTTVGPRRPMGFRKAVKADSLGSAR